MLCLFLLPIMGCIDREALDSSVEDTQMELVLLAYKVQELKSKMEDLETAIGDLSSTIGDYDSYDYCVEYSDAISSAQGDVEYYFSESEDLLYSMEPLLGLLNYNVANIRKITNK